MSTLELNTEQFDLRVLEKLFEEEPYPNSVILVGKKGVGKKTLAKKICYQVNKENPKVLKGNFPDLHCYGPTFSGKNVFQKAEIEEIIEKSYIRPIEGPYKVFIMDQITTFSWGAGEAFLKVLEEPPPKNLYIMTADSLSGIIPTIKSRAINIKIKDLPSQEIIPILKNRYPDSDKLEIISKLSNGSIGTAIDIVNHNLLRIRNKLNELLKSPNILPYDLINTTQWSEFPEDWEQKDKVKLILHFLKTFCVDSHRPFINSDLEDINIPNVGKIINLIYLFETKFHHEYNFQVHLLSFWMDLHYLLKL